MKYKEIIIWFIKNDTKGVFVDYGANSRIKEGLEIISKLGVNIEDLLNKIGKPIFEWELFGDKRNIGMERLIEQLENGGTRGVLELILDTKKQVRD
ncbi:MAG: hypothetical protein ACREBF_03175 [Candidatus Micrarchaeales archaeon]